MLFRAFKEAVGKELMIGLVNTATGVDVVVMDEEGGVDGYLLNISEDGIYRYKAGAEYSIMVVVKGHEGWTPVLGLELSAVGEVLVTYMTECE
jgi:hypothetical protein